MAGDIELFCTLLPSMGHYGRFASDPRMKGIRLNTPMLSGEGLQEEFELMRAIPAMADLYFDVKGRQPRVLEVVPSDEHLEVVINHPIEASYGALVLFKAGNDFALLDHIEDEGTRLVFQGGPEWLVRPGESFHVKDELYVRKGELFNEWEVGRIEAAKAAGFTRYLLSYTESMRDVDQFREMVGRDAEVWLKIENQRGLQFVEEEFVKCDNLTLVAARGDLYVEVDRKHEILAALQHIIQHDPQAVAGSRLLLSVVGDPVPSCADLSELAWLREIGYTRYMLCDELCLQEEMLAIAVNVFSAFADTYEPMRRELPAPPPPAPLLSRLLGLGKR